MNSFLLLAILAVTVLLLYKSSKQARYYLKFIYFILISLLGATLPIPFMLIKPRDCRNAL